MSNSTNQQQDFDGQEVEVLTPAERLEKLRQQMQKDLQSKNK